MGRLHVLGEVGDCSRYRGAALAPADAGHPAQAALYERLRRYVQRFERVAELGIWALLAGGWGVGKTYALWALAHALKEQGRECVVGRAGDVVAALLQRGSSRLSALLQQADLVLIDEASAQVCEHPAFFEAIDARYLARKPVVFAGNAPVARDSDAQVAAFVLGARLADRLLDGAGQVLRLPWGSLRCGCGAAEPVF